MILENTAVQVKRAKALASGVTILDDGRHEGPALAIGPRDILDDDFFGPAWGPNCDFSLTDEIIKRLKSGEVLFVHDGQNCGYISYSGKCEHV